MSNILSDIRTGTPGNPKKDPDASQLDFRSVKVKLRKVRQVKTRLVVRQK